LLTGAGGDIKDGGQVHEENVSALEEDGRRRQAEVRTSYRQPGRQSVTDMLHGFECTYRNGKHVGPRQIPSGSSNV